MWSLQEPDPAGQRQTEHADASLARCVGEDEQHQKGWEAHFTQTFFHNKYHHGLVRWTLRWFDFLDDIRVLINQAKEGAADVNATAGDAITRMQNISEELTKIKISSQDSNLNNLLDDVNKTCQSPHFFFPETLSWYNAHYLKICQTMYERMSFCPGFFNSEEHHRMLNLRNPLQWQNWISLSLHWLTN